MPKSTIRHLEKKDIPELKKLYVKVWNRAFSERMASIFYWKFFSNPLVEEDNNKSLVMYVNDELIGFLGTIPARFKLGDKVKLGYWLCDFMVDPDRRGVGIKLSRQILKEQPLLLGQAGAEAYRIWQVIINKMTGKRIDITGRTLYTKRLNYYFGLKGVVKVPMLANCLNRVWVQYRKIKYENTKVSGLTVYKTEKVGKEFDSFLKGAANSYDNIALRDAAYLNWRFADCPYDKHYILAAKHGDIIKGYIVLRIIEKDQKKDGIVVDLLTYLGDFSTRHFLFQAAFDFFDREKVNIAVTQDGEIKSITGFLKKIGFINQIETKSKSIIGSALPKLGVSDEVIYDPAKWYVSLGDSDFNMDD